MATKATVHPSRQPNVPFAAPQGVKKKKKHAKPNPNSVGGIRTKIRDLTRQLDRAQTLPADIRVEKERELAGYRADLQKLEEASHRRKITGRYHMVRFFERQKATRALKKLQKAAAAAAAALAPTSSPSEQERMQRAVHDAEVDLNYTVYCPLAEPYHSLYPRKGEAQAQAQAQAGANANADDGPLDDDDNDDDDDGGRRNEHAPGAPAPPAAKPPLWKVVEKAMADGTLDALRDGGSSGRSVAVRVGKLAAGANRTARRREERLSRSSGGRQDPARSSTRMRGARKARPSQGDDGGGDDDDAEGGSASDGGFFEE